MTQPNIYRYDIYEFISDIKSLITQLKDKKFDLIVGLVRGGCTPAVALSHALNIPVKMLSYNTRDHTNVSEDPDLFFQKIVRSDFTIKNILIVDDMVDTGQTIQHIINISNKYFLTSIAVLLYNSDIEIDVKKYYAELISQKQYPQWFQFWWEEFK